MTDWKKALMNAHADIELKTETLPSEIVENLEDSLQEVIEDSGIDIPMDIKSEKTGNELSVNKR